VCSALDTSKKLVAIPDSNAIAYFIVTQSFKKMLRSADKKESAALKSIF
jgi:hypothetical protein